mgnify:CR=1 FL=1
MAKFFVDAFADMFGVELKNNGLLLAPSKIEFKGKFINFEGWEKAPSKEILDNISKGKYKLAHISQKEWTDFFTPFLVAGEDIAFFTISQKLLIDGGADLKSAFTKLSEDFPERKVCLVDTLTVSRGVSEIASLSSLVFKKENDFEKAIKFATELAGHFVSAFVVSDTNYLLSNPILEKPGSKLTGGLLNVKPIISIDKEGNFKLLDKARGFKAGVKKLLDIVKFNGENVADYTFSIVYLNAELDALELKNEFLKFVEKEDIRIIESSLNNATIVGNKFIAVTFHSK